MPLARVPARGSRRLRARRRARGEPAQHGAAARVAGRVLSLASRARALRHGPPTALLVPVHGLPLEAHSAPGLPPHVTVLYPFVPARRVGAELADALREALAPFPAFDFALTAVRRFPGVLYLAPDPAGPFVALTEACVARWPEHPPYAGAYAEVIPHLSLAEGPEPAGAAGRAAALLPIQARAEEVWLMAPDRSGRWQECVRVALSGSSAYPS